MKTTTPPQSTPVLARRAIHLDPLGDIPLGNLPRSRRIFSIYQFIESYIGADAGPIAARNRLVTQCFLSHSATRFENSVKGLALQAQKVLDIGTSRCNGLRQVCQKCKIGIAAVSIIVIFRRAEVWKK